jgi:hypothetical protein
MSSRGRSLKRKMARTGSGGRSLERRTSRTSSGDKSLKVVSAALNGGSARLENSKGRSMDSRIIHSIEICRESTFSADTWPFTTSRLLFMSDNQLWSKEWELKIKLTDLFS